MLLRMFLASLGIASTLLISTLSAVAGEKVAEGRWGKISYETSERNFKYLYSLLIDKGFDKLEFYEN
jgi:hypothetical protein